MESFKEFWEIVVDVWEKGLYGVDIGRVIVAVLIFFGFFLLRPLFSRLVIRQLKALTEKTKTSFDDEVLEVIERPIGFVPVVLGAFFAFNVLSLTGEFRLIADRIIRSLIVFVIFWNLVKLVQPLSLLIRQLERILYGMEGRCNGL